MKPEVLLECARKAYPEYEWELINGLLFRSINPDAKNRVPNGFDIFDASKGHAMALQTALKKEGYRFGYWEERKVFYADSVYLHLPKLTTAETEPELLALCVEESMG
jgi:hypothetical protein